MGEQNKIYRLGAVVSIDRIKALVVGYDFVEQDNHLRVAYRIIPYPLGFNGSIKLVTNKECTLIQDGYQNDMSDRVTTLMNICGEVAEKVTPEEMKEYLDELFVGKQVETDGRDY